MLDQELVHALDQLSAACQHAGQLDEVRVVVHIDKLLLTNFKLRHEVIVPVLGRRILHARLHATAEHRLQLLVEPKQLVLPQRVKF